MSINRYWIRHKRLVFIIVLFAIPGLTLLLGRLPLPRLNLYDRLSSLIVHPVAEAGGNLTGGVGFLWSHYLQLVGTSKENDVLKKEVSELNSKILSLEEVNAENERLKKLLSMPDVGANKKIAGKIIGQEGSAESVTYILNIGSIDGVAPRMPVVTSEGIAGTIAKVYRNSSVFVAIADPSHDVDGTIARTRARFVVEGQGRSLLGRLKYLDRADDVRVGDVAVTSGLDGVFPAGLKIGVIVRVNHPRTGISQSAEVRPAVDFGRAEEVLVIDKQAPMIKGEADPHSEAEAKTPKS